MYMTAIAGGLTNRQMLVLYSICTCAN